MADSIFRHEDRDDDELDVYRGNAGALVFHATRAADRELTSVHLNPEDVVQLRDALTEWIGDRSATRPVPNYTTPRDVRFIVSQMLAQVLPLHQTPQAAVPAPLCTDPFCDRFPGTSEHFEHDPEPAPACRCHDADGYSTLPLDPEPRDVGHPLPPEELCARTIPVGAHLASRCTFCGFLWVAHRAPESLPARPPQLVGCECGHRWGVHGGAQCHVAECTCTRLTQADINSGMQP